MEVPWRFHGVLTQIPTKISQNLEQKRRPYCMNDAGSMEVRWSFHGGLMMEFPCSFHLFFTLHPCQDIPGQIGVIYIKTPWNLHGTSIKPASLIQQDHQRGTGKTFKTFLKNPCNLHQTSMETPWNLHQTCIINTTEPLEGKWQDLQNIPGKSM